MVGRVAREHRRRQKRQAKAATESAWVSAVIIQIAADVNRIGRAHWIHLPWISFRTLICSRPLVFIRRRNFQKAGYCTEWTEKDEKHKNTRCSFQLQMSDSRRSGAP